mmetsp:Transcript_4850/g.10654  ORF Transcript_4850/g.10654 Transcript_4850/m.10654 type:complete len:442 (-) Transcript_4850:137-1462(-)
MRGLLTCLVAAVTGFRLRSNSTSNPSHFVQKLVNFQNAQYYGEITLGGQTVLGVFDTGSFDVIVLSKKCQTCQGAVARLYDSSHSSTYKAAGKMAKYVFGSGPANAEIGYELISVGGFQSHDQLFGEITSHQIPVLNKAKFSAIVGMGPGAGPKKMKALLMSFGVNEFSICLERASGAPGWLTWGKDPRVDSPSMVHMAVIGVHHWAVRVWGVSANKMDFMMVLNNQTAGDGLLRSAVGDTSNATFMAATGAAEGKQGVRLCSRGCVAIIDSGTSTIVGPSVAIAALQQEIGKVNHDCSNLNALPELQIEVALPGGGSTMLSLPPEAYVIKVRSELVANYMGNLPKVCVLAFSAMNKMTSGGPLWIMGMPFLRWYYSSFDRVAKTISVARASGSCLPQTTVAFSNGTGPVSHDLVAPEAMDVDIDAAIGPDLEEEEIDLVL